ncbi:tryptophan halogenase family protein [Thalassomonas haliotis]|uniref:Tryptophan 7-halogenase n=1 Tax=Thalassomonas haliotis TaxID=485448 RepID=A0ABY7VNJ1_9GAMM|nr:tryptophan halogenase family protein [Thalassomonas haliotis]WDE14617.1 tryptophan 7-halogenase [Thalassomonas haliotis]
MSNTIKKVVIVGGGSAGWMTAAMLAKLLGQELEITLVESDDIGTIGVGEATIPPIQLFNNVLGINEADFVRETEGTFKLGIQFENWGQLDDSYMHAFGSIGKNLGFTSFHHYWLKAQQEGDLSSFWDYSLNYRAAKANKFAPMEKIAATPLPGIRYAYHFDATAYARYLRVFSERLGVNRIEGKVSGSQLCPDTGNIDAVTMAGGERLIGDLFIDCSGFSALLIEQALKVGFEDWSHWLPCDRAIAVQSSRARVLLPYTRAIARDAGWQWQIPLQHRSGNGLVYCSAYQSDEDARQLLVNNISAKLLNEPRTIQFTTGKRKKLWHKNCVAIGLSSGFLEPLESTSLHLIQSGIMRLVKMFPDKQFHQADIDEYNRQGAVEYQQIRDFIILHYKVNQKTALPFWQACREMSIPESLEHKIALFKSHGRIYREQDELFSEEAWQQVLLGQGLRPKAVHPITAQLSGEQNRQLLTDLAGIIDKTAATMPAHEDFIQRHCRALR